MDFLKKTWIKILSWIFIVVGTVALILGGVGVADISKGVGLIAGVIEAIGVLVAFIASFIKSKDSK